MNQNNKDRISIQVGLNGYSFRLESDGQSQQSSEWVSAERLFTSPELQKKYDEVTDYSPQELLEFVKDQNARAWIVMLIWLVFNAIFGVLYLRGVMDEADLLMLTVFYFLSDYICILFFCPFQSFIMKNRCCVNCRIYDWGHFMMFTPMLFIRNFYSWSLFFTACIVLIKWEVIYARHPERFFYGSNRNLQCANCRDKICQLKKVVK